MFTAHIPRVTATPNTVMVIIYPEELVTSFFFPEKYVR